MVTDSTLIWLEEFINKHGRPPRVLHIGNIANNAYLNAKMLNMAGIESDVLCYDYYHIMGCPEWEDADFEGEVNDQFNPRWEQIDLAGFCRPSWFIQGPLHDCIEYLLEKKCCINDAQLSHVSTRQIKNSCQSKFYSMYRLCILVMTSYSYSSLFEKTVNKIIRHSSQPIIIVRIIAAVIFMLFMPLLVVVKSYYAIKSFIKPERFDVRVSQILALISLNSKEVPIKLSHSDFNCYRHLSDSLQRLFSHYDIVQGYATDGIYPLLMGTPYVAYEHGTIRNIPFEDTLQGRQCALTYKLANYVCITNADNIVAAQRLNLDNYDFVPHPINEEFLACDSKAEQLRIELHTELQSDFIVFHPSRQHWEERRHPDWEKGNDIFIRGFARFTHEVNSQAAAVFVEWGQKVEESKQLIHALGLTERIKWIPPLPNRKMIRYIHATELLADQFFLGAFGSTMPKALACGKPALLYLNEELHRWCFKEMPPVINVATPDQVFSGLKRLYEDKVWAKELAVAGRSWYETYHSNKVIVDKLVSGYSSTLQSVS